MRVNKTIKRENGDRIRISARCWMDGYHPKRGLTYAVDVATCLKGRRNYQPLDLSDDYSYRILSMEDRREFLANEQLKVVSKEEVYEVKLELWEKFKPKK